MQVNTALINIANCADTNQDPHVIYKKGHLFFD